MKAPPENARRRRRPGLLGKLALTAGGVLVGLVILELTLWLIGVAIARDRHARETAAADRPVFTILCMGDSWTEGKPEGNYPDLLVERLNARGSPVRFRRVNRARSGTNSSQMLRRLPGAIAEIRPDLLIVLTGNNDHHNLTDSTYWRFRDESLGWGSTLAARLRIRMHSLRVYRLARAAWQKASGGPTANEFFEARSDGDPGREGLIAIDPATHRRQLEYNLTKVVELARAQGIPVVFQTYFHFHGYRVNEILRQAAWDLGVPLVDNNRAFHTRVRDDLRASYRIEDGHPNPDGYALMADWILEVLDEHRLVP